MTKKEPLVSIVTPVYNAAKFLPETIKTVKNQSYKNWELIFIDDVSTDESASIIEKAQQKDKRIKLIKQKKNAGAAKARNAGTKLASGHYIAFLDADDLWVTDKLAKQVEFMTKGNHIFSYTGYGFADENGVSTGKTVSVPTTITYPQALKNHIIWTSTVVLDMTKLDKSLAMMPDVRRGQDTATWWQILRNTERAYGVDQTMAYYRRTSDSLSANKLKAAKRTWHLFRIVENQGYIKSSYYFAWYGLNAVRKRI